MPPTPVQEELEHTLRVEQIDRNIEKLRSDIRYESRKFTLQMIVTTAVTVGATVAAMTYFAPKVEVLPPAPPPPAPPPQIIINIPPYPASASAPKP